MGIQLVKIPVVRDREDLFQRDVADAFKQLSTDGIFKVTVKGVSLTTSTSLISHQLGRIPVGWIVIDKDANADIWRDATVATTSDKIPLRASAAVTVDIQFW